MRVTAITMRFMMFTEVHAYLVELGGARILFDTGPIEEFPVLWDGLGHAPPDFVVLTHNHIDHTGGVHRLVGKCPILAPEMGDGFPSVPRQPLGWAAPLLNAYAKSHGYGPFPYERDLAPIIGLGVEVIPTPGHAFQHFAYRLPTGDLIAGDAFGSRDGRPVRNFIRDDDALLRASEKVLQDHAEGEWVYPMHGAPVRAADFRAWCPGP